MSTVVTGGSGFVGRHTVRAVARLTGEDPEVLDRVEFSPGYRRVELRDADAGDIGNASSVIHCAAHADVRNNWTSIRERSGIWQDNMTATVNLLEACRDSGTVRRFVFVSTGAVYASHQGGVVSEDSAVEATSPYAASKLAGEAYVQAYAEEQNWEYYIVRPAACVGSGYTHGHVADFVRQMAEYGTICGLDDGRTEQNLVHVEDLALMLARLSMGGYPSGIYNCVYDLWSWPRTIVEMSAMAGRRVVYTKSDRADGWVGANKGARMSRDKSLQYGLAPSLSVAEGVRASMRSLGWPCHSR